MDRRDYYFEQLVTGEELDAGFEGAEVADRALASDMGLFGIKTGGVVTEHSPVANLTVDLDNETDPFIAYDALGRRLYSAASQNIDMSVDEFGNSTTVGTAGHERWLALFARFVRAESDPRIDGNGNALNFVQNEAVEFFVRQGASAAIGAAARVTLNTEFVLLADIKRTNGDTVVNTADISTTRRQDFTYVGADRISVDPDDLSGQTIITGVNVGECLGEIGNAVEDLVDRLAETDDPPGSGATECGATFVGVREYATAPFTAVFVPDAGTLDALLEQVVGLANLAAKSGHYYVDEVAATVPASSSVLVALSVASIRPSIVNVYCEAANGTSVTQSAVHYVGAPTNKWCVRLFNSSASDVAAKVEYSRRYSTT